MLTKESLEIAVRNIHEQFQRLHERHTELIVILITSIIVALLVNVLALPLQTLVQNIASVLCMPKETVYLLLTIILLLCVFSIGILYLSKPITFETSTFLLVNKDLGIVYPNHPSVEYSAVGTIALQTYLRDTKSPLALDEYLIRDLLEVFLVDWLASTTLFKIEMLSGFARPKIRYPKLGKGYRELKVRDILARFGENRFTKYLEGEHPTMFSSIKLPEKLTITCRRYENERIRLEPYEDTTWVRIASELRIEGPRFSPLKIFRIVLYITRITLGEPLLLRLEYNCRSVAVGPDRIECVDKNGRHILITGKERKKLSSWVEIDFDVAILAEIRPYLFVHPVFGEILTWLRNLCLRAIDYFTPKLSILF